MKRRKDKSILDMCGKLTAPPGVHVRIEEMNAWPTETDAEDAELLAKVRESACAGATRLSTFTSRTSDAT